MKICLVIPFFAFVFLLSCDRQTSRNHYTETDSDSVNAVLSDSSEGDHNNSHVYLFKDFDWSGPHSLKSGLSQQINEQRKNAGEAITDFFKDYETLINDMNLEFFHHKDYETLNALFHTPYNDICHEVVFFAEKADSSGFRIISREGMIELAKNTDFIKGATLHHLKDPASREFIKLYALETDSVCCKDAALVLPVEEIALRVYRWGELSERLSSTGFEEMAAGFKMRNLRLILLGIDNSPAFDFITKRYHPEYRHAIANVIDTWPDSYAAEEFRSFYQLLVSENFTKTPEVKKYLADKFK